MRLCPSVAQVKKKKKIGERISAKIVFGIVLEFRHHQRIAATLPPSPFLSIFLSNYVLSTFASYVQFPFIHMSQLSANNDSNVTRL